MKIRFFIGMACLCICFLVSCSPKQKYAGSVSFSWSDFTERSVSDTLALPRGVFLQMPLRLLCEDSTLFVQNRQGDKFIHRFRLPGLDPLGEGQVELGNGPQELLSAYRMQVDGSLFWLFDLMGQSAAAYDKRTACDSVSFPVCRKIKLEEPFGDIVALPDHRFITASLNPNHKRLSFFTPDGRYVSTAGEYPSFGAELSLLETVEAYVCEMVCDPVNEHVWLFYKQTDLIEIYTYDGKLVKRLHGPDCFFPAVSERSFGNGMQKVSSIPGETRDAYFCPLYSDGKMYVLYSGRVFERGQSAHAYLFDTLLSFHSDGTPDTCYKLPVPVYTFTIDELEGVLYGLSFDPEYHLIKSENLVAKISNNKQPTIIE